MVSKPIDRMRADGALSFATSHFGSSHASSKNRFEASPARRLARML